MIEQSQLRDIMDSLAKTIRLNDTGCVDAGFLTSKALSIKIYLGLVLRNHGIKNVDFDADVVQLMKVLQEPQQQVSPLTLCATLGSVFWQTMMGAIASPSAEILGFYVSRLRRIV